ncbi:hypothetical protein LWI28_026517 [Acer negundo]|uniref:RPW8 domain-containing protein n=1 Tax=Acer negundo TaxID=4023 RepID=A0AAD5IIQ4_ACENE|nr:hypothetical protein LWI28_011129 [Acer negundo]KAI9165311.1 hypothetical protein LWI28_011558 [Acer negundo]KAI9165584.1 hypothetical protein LWI28_016921 [Acer negundo]KAI9166115.1 hypothetical protein LWI28_026517 [Acer negundo]KAK4840227.1 hypothetical protein QYF36_003115 [Acer negundo]
MPGFEDLVLGPVLGLVLQQFYEGINQAREKTKKFDVVLTNLQNTVISVKPRIDEISKMDKDHDDYPKQEIVVFLKQLEKGKELVATCADIPSWNKYKRRKYAKRLVDMDSSLRKLLEVQFQAEQMLDIKKMLSEMTAINKKLDRMNIEIPVGVSGGGESSNAAAADQPSDDQTAGRRSRFELRFRSKKENGETDINLSF